jgi:general secretion pathway protein K
MKRRSLSNGGSVLVIALWALILLTVFAVHLAVIARQKIMLARRLDERDKLFYIAEAGVKKAIAELRKVEEPLEVNSQIDLWQDHMETFKDIAVGEGLFSVTHQTAENHGGTQRYGLADEGAKININQAGADVLERLMQMTSGLRGEEAMRLSYAIVDWRDKDSFYQHPQHGAEDKDYQNEEIPYEAKDADFELIDELLLVRGMNWEIFAGFKDFITVYGDGKININTASRTVLRSLGLGEKLAEDILAFRKGADMIEGTEDDIFFSSAEGIVTQIADTVVLGQGEVSLLSGLVEGGAFSVQSAYFLIRSVAALNARKAGFEIVAVVNHNGYIQYWREYF